VCQDSRLSSKQGLVCGDPHNCQSNVKGVLDRVLPLPTSRPTSSLTQSESQKNKEKLKTLNSKPILSSQSASRTLNKSFFLYFFGVQNGWIQKIVQNWPNYNCWVLVLAKLLILGTWENTLKCSILVFKWVNVKKNIYIRVISTVTLSSPCLWASFHPIYPLSVVSIK
jgi:hypothetical protein